MLNPTYGVADKLRELIARSPAGGIFHDPHLTALTPTIGGTAFSMTVPIDGSLPKTFWVTVTHEKTMPEIETVYTRHLPLGQTAESA